MARQVSNFASDRIWIGVDIGGTFTDLVGITGDGQIFTEKVLSSVHDYSEAIAVGIAAILERAAADAKAVQEVVHATTVATRFSTTCATETGAAVAPRHPHGVAGLLR